MSVGAYRNFLEKMTSFFDQLWLGKTHFLQVRSSQPSLFVAAFQEKFPSAILKEQHYHKAVFQLSISDDPLSNLSLAEVFEMLEDRRQELKIEDYSVSQTTLDDVFINFAKKQGNSIEENPPTKSWYNALRSWVSSRMFHFFINFEKSLVWAIL